MHTEKHIVKDGKSPARHGGNGHSRDIADGHGSKRQKIGSENSNTGAHLGHNGNTSSCTVAAATTASSNSSVEPVDHFANTIKAAGIKAVALDCDNTLWAHTRGRIRKGRSAFACKVFIPVAHTFIRAGR